MVEECVKVEEPKTEMRIKSPSGKVFSVAITDTGALKIAQIE